VKPPACGNGCGTQLPIATGEPATPKNIHRRYQLNLEKLWLAAKIPEDHEAAES
jgi:hypothetical protein